MQHDDAVKRALVDEALNRTPPGGFPELERRHGLRAGSLFDWVAEHGGMDPPPPSATHFWIGTTGLDEAAFCSYFDHDPAYWSLEVDEIERAPADVTGCAFSVDLGERFLYDEELLWVSWRPTTVPAGELIEESRPASEAVGRRIAEACAARGIATANAAFAYADPAQRIREPGALFNGLVYLGLFEV
ncbi:immunity 22 family protein [Herbiconiux sp. 11R-BC]|uniref:immunity 22 family protein n=1 Tax=Herbiconiux sp. 11R-BC TaxID=3111637 RepID=UPI003C0DC914